MKLVKKITEWPDKINQVIKCGVTNVTGTVDTP
jgi:hypothetical protein